MSIIHELAKSLEILTELNERGQAWLQDVQRTRDSIQKIVASPMAMYLLGQDSCAYIPPSGSYHVPASTGAFSLLMDLQACTEQVEAAVLIARANQGRIDLREATALLREAGLSNARTDRDLRKNLGTRMIRSGKFIRVDECVYDLVELVPRQREPLVSEELAESIVPSAQAECLLDGVSFNDFSEREGCPVESSSSQL